MTPSPNNPTPAPDTIPTRAKLGVLGAIWNSLWSRSADFYPRIVEPSPKPGNFEITSMSSEGAVAEMAGEAGEWGKIARSDELKAVLDLARQSLNEVKAQTEYQDGKATRLLTVATFLSALSGALFTRFVDSYPFPDVARVNSFSQCLIIAAYAVFGVSILAGLSGAIVIFHATRTRFKYPEQASAVKQDRLPKSFLFFRAVIEVRPKAWMRAWVDNSYSPPHIQQDVGGRYLSNLVSETYLISAKTADKLRYLEPAQALLAWSLRLLFFWILLLAPIAVFIPKTASVPAPTEIRLIGVSGNVPVDVRHFAQPVAPVPRDKPVATIKAGSGATP